jgi:hypothetical protein
MMKKQPQLLQQQGDKVHPNLSNLLRLLPDSILLRVFGGHGMIDRDVENSTYAALDHAGLAPKYYGRFANGRIEEYKYVQLLLLLLLLFSFYWLRFLAYFYLRF